MSKQKIEKYSNYRIKWLGRFLLKVGDILYKSPLSFLFAYSRFFILNYLSENCRIRRKLSKTETRLASEKDLPGLERLVDRKGKTAIRIKRGNICFIAESNGKIVGMEWLEIAEKHFERKMNYLFTLSQNSCWLFDGYIDSEYRLKGVWVNLMLEIDNYMKEKSIKEAFCLIEDLNELSINTHLKFGFHIKEEIIYIKVLGINIHLIKKKNEKNKYSLKVAISNNIKNENDFIKN